MKTYTMLPIARPANWRPAIQQIRATPTIGNQLVLVHYRVFGLDPVKAVATIASNARGHEPREVNVSSLHGGVEVGDILGYETTDTAFMRPRITHRHHQRHQHPKHLV